MRIWLCKDTGAINRPLRLAEWFVGISWCVRHVISRPLAAVGADLSCPHIRKCPQNGEQKCVCGDLNIRILRCGHPFAMKRIHVFDNVENTDLTMQGYGHDESAPTPGGVVRGHFVVCSQRY